MRLRGPAAVTATVLLAAAVAAVGAAANLYLLESHRTPDAPVVLGISIINGATTSETAGPPLTRVDPGDAPTTTLASPPATSATTAPITTTPVGEDPSPHRTYAVGLAGTVTVTVRSGTLVVDSVVPSAGWSYAIEEQRSDEVEISFRRAAGVGEASFHASVDSGDLRVEIEPGEGESPDD